MAQWHRLVTVCSAQAQLLLSFGNLLLLPDLFYLTWWVLPFAIVNNELLGVEDTEHDATVRLPAPRTPATKTLTVLMQTCLIFPLLRLPLDPQCHVVVVLPLLRLQNLAMERLQTFLLEWVCNVEIPPQRCRSLLSSLTTVAWSCDNDCKPTDQNQFILPSDC